MSTANGNSQYLTLIKVINLEMEKKSYVAPQCLVVELGVMNMLAASIEVNASSKDGVNDMGVNRRRGEWGDLWSEN